MKPPAFRSLLALIVVSTLATPFAGAIVTAAGTVTSSLPSGNPGFDNIGQVNGASAIYLGGGWVMTADHVAGSLPGSVTFGGTSYGTQSGSWQRLTNPSSGTSTDIVLFRLASDPGLASLTLKSTAPTVGSPVMYVGNGKVQQTSLTNWSVTFDSGTGHYIWTESGSPADAAGFKTTASNEVTWGVNDIAGINQVINIGHGDLTTFYTIFDSGAYLYEGQAVVGDSGGGVFFFDGTNWVLGGMTDAVATYPDQPANTAVFGDATYAADLSTYADQIASITGITLVPEPSAMLMVLGGVVLVVRRRR